MKKALSLTTSVVIVILIGFVLWGIFYLISPAPEAKNPVKPVIKEQTYVPEQDGTLLQEMLVVANDDEFAKTVSIKYSTDLNSYEDGATIRTFDEKKNAHPQILVRAGLSSDQQRRTVAHEYLHAAFTRIPNQDSVIAEVESLYANDGYMRQRMASYISGGRLNSSELFSVYCTESSDAYLTVAVVTACNQMIDRSTLVFVR